MVVLADRAERNTLRQAVMKAEERKVISRDEAGFIITLVERFRSDIEKKIKQTNILQGELSQLRANESVIVGLIDSMVKAAERDLARQETMQKIREAKEGAVEEDNKNDEVRAEESTSENKEEEK